MTDRASTTKRPAHDGQEDLLLGGQGHGAQDPPQGQGPHVPHEDLGRVGVEPQEADAGAHQGPQEDGELRRLPGRKEICR